MSSKDLVGDSSPPKLLALSLMEKACFLISAVPLTVIEGAFSPLKGKFELLI